MRYRESRNPAFKFSLYTSNRASNFENIFQILLLGVVFSVQPFGDPIAGEGLIGEDVVRESSLLFVEFRTPFLNVNVDDGTYPGIYILKNVCS